MSSYFGRHFVIPLLSILKMMKKGLIIGILFLIFSIEGKANNITLWDSATYCEESPDSIVYRELDEIKVYPKKGVNINSREYARMVKKIKKVYPFAKEAAVELRKYNEMYLKIKKPKERKQYVKKIEKELFKKHEDDIRHMTISEGRYLLLLIDRETGSCSYELIKGIKGSFSAFFWQGVAKVFKNDLKEEYDPEYKHFVIEQIVQNIEKGKI
ncbi:MAG: hypothetical protein BWY08_01404 [Bacteroidetes bacterium ADurb.Bin174]|nr:MAG: hypothetical protein BWY08_01404 [Bacteroidetes bacterium ADurb.Bin174]